MPYGTDGAGIGNLQRRRTRRRGNSSSLEFIARWTEAGAIPIAEPEIAAPIYPVAKRNQQSCGYRDHQVSSPFLSLF